jgi:serine/threonine-protein kinase
VIGERFGNYRAVSLLGEGGMGAVYLAEHPGIGRRVAIKVLRPDMGHDPQLLTRFLNEARAANAIRHPNIIEVLDSGTTDKGMSYLVMELLEGEVLSARIKRLSRLDERSAIEIAMQAASGLGAAHAKGITHRDLKPDNIFVIPEESDPSRERVKILDFGIAKLHSLSGDSLKTRTGTLMGTPIYMSPEQCLGTKEVDHRSDVYSLGVILYEMLAGRPPFVSEGFGELLTMHLHEPAPPLRQFAPQLSSEIEFAVLKMLVKKPDGRYQSMADVRAALAVAAGLPHAVGPEHKLGDTDQFGVRATATASVWAPVPAPTLVAPTTLTPGGLEKSQFPGTTMKVRRKPWVAIGAVAGLLLVAALAIGLLHKNPDPAPAMQQPSTEEHESAPAKAAPSSVQLHLQSTPTGARVVRVSDGVVLGTTPETIELRPSAEPLLLRFEKEGFVPSTREASLASDTTVAAALEATPEKPVPATKKHTGNKARPSSNEPAKL